jgi:hypothetical protein
VKRALLVCLLVTLSAGGVVLPAAADPGHPGPGAPPDAGPAVNLAVVANASTSYVSGHETLAALNDGFDPAHSNDKRHGAYGNWPRTGTQWVQYDWSQPVSTNRIDVYWFDDRRGVRLPRACRLTYWDGGRFVPVPSASGLGVAADRYNTTAFAEVTTSRLRLDFDGCAKSGVTTAEAARFADQAVAALRDAISAGGSRPDEREEPDFDPLRGRDDFQELLAEPETRNKAEAAKKEAESKGRVRAAGPPLANEGPWGCDELVLRLQRLVRYGRSLKPLGAVGTRGGSCHAFDHLGSALDGRGADGIRGATGDRLPPV